MKRIIFLTMLLLLGSMIASPSVSAQKTEKKEKNTVKQTEADLLRQLQEMRKQKEEMIKQLEMEAEAKGISSKEYEFFMGMSDDSREMFYKSNGSINNSVTVTNTLRNSTRQKKYTFKVDSGSVNIRFSLSVACEKGKILITLYTPDGKKYNGFEIYDGESSVWSQSLQLKDAGEKERKKYIGEWSVLIKSYDATGRYHISVATR